MFTNYSRRRRLAHLLEATALLIVCALGLFSANFGLATKAQQSSSMKAGGQATAKRPLNHQDYDGWRSIQGQAISRDGKFIAYALIPQDGDGEIIVRNLATGAEWRYGRGWRPPTPPPDADETPAPAALAQAGRAARVHFTADGRFAAFTIEPNKDDVLKARKEKKAPDAMPKNALGIVDLSNGQVTRVERVKSFQAPEDAPGWIAYQLEAKPAEKKAEDKAAEQKQNENDDEDFQQRGRGAAGGRTGAPRKEYGSDLVLRNLTTGVERTFADALEYNFSKDARTLVFTVSSKKEEANGVYAVTPGADGPPVDLLTGKGKYSKIAWDEAQTQLAFISDRDEAAAKQQTKGAPPALFKLYHWDRKAAKATEIVSTATQGFRAGMVISERGALSFSRDGGELFLGAAPPPEPEKDAEAGAADADDKVIVDLWHWKDDYIQPMQKVRAEQDRNRSYRAVYHIKERKFVQLADATMEGVNPSADGQWAIGSDDREYRILVGRDTNYSDVYLVNTADGSRKLLLKKSQFPATFSPGGKYAVFFDGKDWGSISFPDCKFTNLTKSLGVAFWREETDTPSVPGAYGAGGWTKDDKYVLLYDKYDVWQIAPDGSSAKNLTDGVGRKEKIEFRVLRPEQDGGGGAGRGAGFGGQGGQGGADRSPDRGIDPAKPLLLAAENEWTRDSGFYRDRIDGGMPEKLLMAAKNFSAPVKAKDADVLMLTGSRFDEYPDILVADPDFKALKKVSDAGKQKDQFTWGKAELVRYKNSDGVPLSGILIKPDDFDPKRKYPMIVYIYERLSEGLHRFVEPRPAHSINASFYASNGYLVLMPDIVYTIGYPGQSALKCVLPAIQSVVDL